MVGNWGNGAIWRISSGVFPSNAYFCETETDGRGLLIDPGLDGDAIDAALGEIGLRPTMVLCTHGHFDHTGSASLFQRKYGVEVLLHQADARINKASNFMLMAIKVPATVTLADHTYITDHFECSINGHSLRFLPTPGHTPGSCVIEIGSAWFTGDTLYSRGVGLSGLPGEDKTKLRSSLEMLWPELTAGRWVYPGHGASSTGAEIRSENLALLNFMGRK